MAGGWVEGGFEGGQKVAFGGFWVAFGEHQNRHRSGPFERRFGIMDRQNQPQTDRETKWGGGGWVGKCKKWIEKWLRVDRAAMK